jgi:signal transduction histidine kinase
MRAGPALRVAAVATLLIACVYAIAASAVFALTSARLTGQADARLGQMLASARHDPLDLISDSGPGHDSDGDNDRDNDTDDSPAYLWIIARAASGGPVVAAQSESAPALPASVLRTLPAPGHTLHLLRDGEFVVGPVLLLAMFGGSLIVGMRALAPVEQSRRRQLEFTADASHELRTPLSVLRAEVDVALSARRPAAAYRDSLIRVRSEGERLSRLVDDLLWLARFDSEPPPPGDEPVDVATLAAGCADRFRAVGPAVTADTGTGPALISAPPEWIDRLMGVLMDNACRYAGPDGTVRISVKAEGGRMALAVEDSGPGVPEEQRPRLFDRFQRAEHSGSGAGLGLAIGDAIVRSTGGRWRVAASPLGGALFEVSWRHQHKLPG